jgi:hypothetical protein
VELLPDQDHPPDRTAHRRRSEAGRVGAYERVRGEGADRKADRGMAEDGRLRLLSAAPGCYCRSAPARFTSASPRALHVDADAQFPKSAVSREMCRNRGQRGYRFKQAEAKAQARQAIRSKPRKLRCSRQSCVKCAGRRSRSAAGSANRAPHPRRTAHFASGSPHQTRAKLLARAPAGIIYNEHTEETPPSSGTPASAALRASC